MITFVEHIQKPNENPCNPSPCGPNSQCRVVGETPACSCLINYVGRPPNCRPECTINPECASYLACVNEKCIDPCPGSCGVNTECTTINHKSICTCMGGFTGDPFAGCSPISKNSVDCIHNSITLLCIIFTAQKIDVTASPCSRSPCGANAICKERNGAGSCTCLPQYFGDPYTGCRPECVTNADCLRDKACANNKCVDPCPGLCGLNAECKVSNHNPSCICVPGYTGNPSTGCYLLPPSKPNCNCLRLKLN